MLKPILLLAVIAVSAVGLATTADAQGAQARVRVLHASPDAPAVDIYVDGNEAISDLAYEGITDYVALPAGSHNFKVFPASANGTGTPAIDATANLASGADYTISAVGQLASIEGLVLQDNNAAPPSGKAKLRVVHASPDAPNVDIFAQGAGVVVPNLAFKSASNYLELAAGTYDLQVRAAGTETVALNLPGVVLEAGKVYSAFAIGLAAGTPALEVKLTTDATAPAAQATPAPTASAPTAPATAAPPTAAPAAVAPAAVPVTGGPTDDSGSSGAWWIALAGISVVVAGLGAGSWLFAKVRQP